METVRSIRDEVTAMTGLPKICPDDWLGQMATILFPSDNAVAFKETLYHDHGIEMPTMAPDGQCGFRVSINGYNTDADVDYLLKTLKTFL